MVDFLKKFRIKGFLIVAGVVCILMSSACLVAIPPAVALGATIEPSGGQLPVKFVSISSTHPSTSFSQPSSTATPIGSQMGLATPTFTPTATYAILRAQVMVRSNCRYGPGAPYLYKYGLVPGSNLEVIGRNDLGTWILVRAIGGTNPCWVKASLMDIQGDVMSVAPTYISLPQSPYYPPLRGITAQRKGDEVTISWRAVQFRPGDETASPPYLVEAWVCRGGKIIFIPLGVYQNTAIIRDEAGCRQPSHGRVLLAEKHGYTRPVEIPWPPSESLNSR